MDIQQVSLLLEKINALHKSIHLDNEVSAIERDLMMSYIRQLYESYMEVAITPAAAKKIKTSASSAKVVPVVAPKPKKAAPKVVPPPVAEEVVQPAPTPTPPPPAAPTPPPAPKVEEPPIRAAVEVAPTPSHQSTRVSTNTTQAASPAIQALFRHQAAKELSEKLGQQNITDLTRALSINDKLLYSNELFGRDMASMNTTLQDLNRLSSMQEAQDLLISIASKNNWADSEKAEVAESFIKLVRRRY